MLFRERHSVSNIKIADVIDPPLQLALYYHYFNSSATFEIKTLFASDFHQSNSGTLSGILVGRNGSTLGKNVGNNDDSFEKVNIELPSEEGTQTFEQPAQKSKLVIYCKLLHEINLQMYSTGIQTS